MWYRRLGLALMLLAAGVLLLFQPARDSAVRVSADTSVSAPSNSQMIFLPFISQVDPLKRDPLWRFGVDRVRRPITDYDLLDRLHMRLGWYINFGVDPNPSLPNGMEFVQMVRMKQWKVKDGNPTLCCMGCSYLEPHSYKLWTSPATLQSIASSRPGMMWIVGNEMERIDWYDTPTDSCGRQDEMLPELYAQAYHEVYTAIKTADPTAQIAVGALVQPSPLRIQWMERALAEYQRLYGVPLPADAWTIHVYVYNEKSCAVHPEDCWGADIPAGINASMGTPYKVRDHKDFNKAWEMIVAWRAWMKAKGYQNKPLLTPEYGVVLPEWVRDPEIPHVVLFTPQNIRDSFMYPSFNYFLNYADANLGYPQDGYRMMQRWAWWSMDYDNGVCDPDDNTFYPDNTGNLFHSGLGPSNPPTNCPYPAQGLSQFGHYWIQYVQTLPAGATKPYAPVLSAPAPRTSAPARSSMLALNAESTKCSDSPQARSQFLRSLPDRNTPAGQRAWLMALTRLTAGAQICQP